MSEHESIGWDIDAHSTDESMNYIAELIDHANDHSNLEEAQSALKLRDKIFINLDDIQKTEINYYKANAWSVIRHGKHSSGENIWEWDQTEILQEIYWLRSSIKSLGFSSLNKFRQCQILTNTGNILSHIGRPIEAIEYWNRAIKIMPNFAMALGNLGLGLESYAKYFYDHGHAAVLIKEAHDLLRSVNNPNTIWDGDGYQQIRNWMLNRSEIMKSYFNFELLSNISLTEHSLGRSKTERLYRKWAIENCLFLSPLNDLGDYPIAAHDVLHLPDMILAIDQPPNLIGFFNQLKQEFVSSRFFLWQEIVDSSSYKNHFSDRDVLLLNTLDYPAYSISVEQIKIAFKMAYSLFDKIAFFINYYWSLGHSENAIYFHSVWFKNKDKKQLHPCFLKKENLALRGLYWLSKDFIEKDSQSLIVLGETMEPDAYKLRSIRNHLEHKYLKVHDDLWTYGRDFENPLFRDNLAFHLSVSELIEKTMRIIKLARSALIYLSFAVHQEERIKAEEDGVIRFPMSLPRMD